MFALMQVLLFVVGAVFWVDAAQGSHNFSVTTWGSFAYSFPAEFWAGFNMLCAGTSLMGLVNPTHRKLVILGGGAHIIQHLALSYSAIFTGGDVAVGLYASVFFVPVHILMVAGAIEQWKLR